MNFRFMPELEWRWGYFVVWGLMLCVVAAMLYYFRKKRWL
jgi:magnesium transporter